MNYYSVPMNTPAITSFHRAIGRFSRSGLAATQPDGSRALATDASASFVNGFRLRVSVIHTR